MKLSTTQVCRCGSMIIGGAVLFAGGFHILAGAIAVPAFIISLIQWIALQGKGGRDRP